MHPKPAGKTERIMSKLIIHKNEITKEGIVTKRIKEKQRQITQQ